MVDRWAYGRMLCRAHPASREPGLPSPPTLACKVRLWLYKKLHRLASTLAMTINIWRPFCAG